MSTAPAEVIEVGPGGVDDGSTEIAIDTSGEGSLRRDRDWPAITVAFLAALAVIGLCCAGMWALAVVFEALV